MRSLVSMVQDYSRIEITMLLTSTYSHRRLAHSIALLIFVSLAISNTGSVCAQSPAFFVERKADSLDIKLDDRSIAKYYFRHQEVARPFFAHVRTPSGIQVTRNFPPIEGTDPTDHPTMHPGIWLAFANINGVNYWHNNDGKVLHDGFEEEPEPGESVRFATRERYVDSTDAEVCKSVTSYVIESEPVGWMLMIDTTIQSESDLKFVVKEEMGLGIRVATPISVKAGNGSISSATGGENEKGTWGQHDRWWDYSGKINGQQVGMMVMSAPDNPPIWSHSRDYGLLVANPFPVDRQENRGKQTVVKRGETLRLQFGILVFESNSLDRVDHNRAYDRYVGRTK